MGTKQLFISILCGKMIITKYFIALLVAYFAYSSQCAQICGPGYEAHAIEDSTDYECVLAPRPLAQQTEPYVRHCPPGEALTGLTISVDGAVPDLECAKVPK